MPSPRTDTGIESVISSFDGTFAQAVHPRFHVADGGEDEHAHAAVLGAQALKDRETIDAGKKQVKNDEVEGAGRHSLERILAADGRLHDVALGAERPRHEPADARFVVHDQQTRHIGSVSDRHWENLGRH